MAASSAALLDPAPGGHAFLGVARSLRGLRWVERLDVAGANSAALASQQHGLPEIVARLLVGRGVAPGDCAQFLTPTLRDLMPDPSTLRDMDQGADRFARAIRDRERIAVVGDYDVDGAASVALVERFLRAHGLPVRVYVPDRLTEGYGPNPAAMRRLAEEGAALILTVDCGSTSIDAARAARDAGADVIVLDHHRPGEIVPAVHAMINPNRDDDLSGQGDLAAAGVVFLFLVATARVLRGSPGLDTAPDLLGWLDLVALATVCDLAPLRGLNRAFVVKGLQVMRLRQNPGLRALMDRAGLKEPPSAATLGFILGPRINASGRIGECGLGARLLSTDDDLEGMRIAETLERLNGERRALELRIFEDALARAGAVLSARPEAALIAVAGDRWHPGVLGLVASRLAERFGRPAVAVGWLPDGTGVGSGRGIAGVDLGAGIRAAVAHGLLTKGGGHAMAAGLTVDRERFAGFVAFMEQALQQGAGRIEPSDLLIDGVLSLGALTPDLVTLIDRAGPFGGAHPQPRFAVSAQRVAGAQLVGGDHIRLSLSDARGGRIDAMAFRAADGPLAARLMTSAALPLHVAGHLRRDSWGGRDRVRLVIEDAAETGRSPCGQG